MCAARILDEKNKGVETPSDETFQKIWAMFPPRKNKDLLLPVPEATAKRLTHFKPANVIKGNPKLSGRWGVSHLDAKSFKRAILSKVFRKEATRIVDALTDIINKLSASGVKGKNNRTNESS